MTEKDIIQETNRYYRARAPWHDDYMSYTNYDEMVKLLEPLVKPVQEAFAGRDVLEIACGTGTWTQVIARVANSVLATDVVDTMIDIAKVKTTGISTINYKAADAYSLGNIDAEFNAAFAADWWSHIPLSKIKQFLNALYSKLQTDSVVIFLDMLPDERLVGMTPHTDNEGNRIGVRTLPDGNEYEVIKNFQTKVELCDILEPFSKTIDYIEYDELKRWMIKYTLK